MTAGGPVSGSLPELPLLAQERRRTLLAVLPLAAVASAIAATIVPRPAQGWPLDAMLFGAAALVLMVVLLLVQLRRLGYRAALTATIATCGAVQVLRVVSLLTGSTYDDPQASLLNATYAYFPVFFTFLTIALPYPASARYSIALWLAFAAGVTALTARFWGATPPREGLASLLLLVWVGYPLFILLAVAAARRHLRMVELYWQKAEAAESATRRAQESAAHFGAIFNQAAVGMATLDAQGRWLNVNQRVCDITGYGADELLQSDFQSITHPDDLAADLDLGQRVLRGEIERDSLEKRYIRKDGSFVWIRVYVSRLDGPAPSGHRFVAVIEDISERKAAEARLARLNAELEQRVQERTRELQARTRALQAANENLEQFAYVASHDLKAPVRSMISFAQLIDRRLQQGAPVETLRELTGVVAESGKHLVGLLETMMQCSRLGHIPREQIERCPLRRIVDTALLALRSTIEARGARIEIGELPELETAPTLLVQVFQNLIGNAIKFQPGPAPWVGIYSEPHADGWVIRVEDHGPGIEPRLHEEVFRLFRRGAAPDDVEGSGVGLAAARRIVAALGGRIWLESTPGQGSIFKILHPPRAIVLEMR